MKIYVLGSTTFVGEMVAMVDRLKEVGHDGWIHPHLARIENGEHANIKIEHDYIRQHYKHILASNAVLVVNSKKNGIKGYIGGNVLIELGQAYVNDKKIFLLNQIPEMPYTEEILALQPIILDGDLSKI